MATQLIAQRGLRVAVEGCGHGTLHSIYASVAKAAEAKGWDSVDLLIIGGDFQAVRNAYDLNCMSVPVKYREIGDFHEYYSGARKAPYLTIFIGGNHEASNHLSELFYGGWAAPNIYYMGAANVVRLGSLRIAGLSGIWKGYNYKKPHYERLPYNQDDVKSIYHVREYDTRKLLQIRSQVDVGLSHDWPRGIEWNGDWKQLFRKKKHFEEDARTGQLGSVAAKYVLDHLRPAYWFSAHLHIKYPATVEHQGGDQAPAESKGLAEQHTQTEKPQKNQDEIDLDLDMDEAEPQKAEANPAASASNNNADEIDLDLDEEDNGTNGNTKSTEVPEDLRAQLPAAFSRPAEPSKPATLPPPEAITNKTTKFLALDKCMHHREFLQLLEVEPVSQPYNSANFERPLRLEYDKEWLAITRVFAHDLPVGGHPSAAVAPDKGNAHYRPLIEQEEAWVEEHVVKPGKMVIPEDFAVTAPVYEAEFGPHVEGQPKEYTNPHTKAFCELLQIPVPFDATEEDRAARMAAGPKPEEELRGGGGRGGFRGGHAGRWRGRGGRGRGRGRGRGGGGGRH